MREFFEVKPEFIKNNSKTILPVRSTKHSAGYDIYSKEDVDLLPDSIHLFWTDVKIRLYNDEVFLIFIRSSSAIKQGLMLVNSVGICDADYYNNPTTDGNIGICIRNMSKEPVIIKQGDRIAQGIVLKYLSVMNSDIDQNKNQREGDFGSTNKNN